ncbi:NCF2-like protein [Mya arenaria]|uniref:NCF2-like protein n=1 Tax=Mya arenaria TaxID=6604 RepID=A0ABY7DVB6_MYAAR|nr:NCF2-like protein [Mya arenaria]
MGLNDRVLLQRYPWCQTMKETLQIWKDALTSQRAGRHEEAVTTYSTIDSPSARIYYNIACACLNMDQEKNAIENFTKAVQTDQLLAIAYFQRGTIYLKSKSIIKSLSDLKASRDLLRGNTYIDYRPLGLHVLLNLYQILHNLALAGKRDDLTPITVSVDRFFSPPNDVTKTLTNPNTPKIARAKVVTATDTDDMEKSFNFSKKAREIKAAQENSSTSTDRFKPRSPLSPRNWAPFNIRRKFAKQKTSSNEATVTSEPIRGCKSLSDLGSLANASDDVSEQSENKIEFKGARYANYSNWRLSVPEIAQTLSADDVSKLSQMSSKPGRKKSSPFAGVRRLLQKKTNSRKSETIETHPSAISGSRSMSDITSLSQSSLDVFNFSSSSEDEEALTSALKANFFLSSSLDGILSLHHPSQTQTSEPLDLDLTTPVFEPQESIELHCGDSADSRNTKFQSLTNQDSPLSSKQTAIHEVPSIVITDDKIDDVTRSEPTTGKDVTAKRRSRPPPPSYPPPPLPPAVAARMSE